MNPEKMGVVIVPVSRDGRTWMLLDKLGENVDKYEKNGYDEKTERLPIIGLMQFLGGMVEDGESELEAGVREIGEEIMLEVDQSQLVYLGVGTKIDYQKPGWTGLVGVSVYAWALNEEQESALLDKGAVWVYGHEEKLRERDRIVGMLYQQVVDDLEVTEILKGVGVYAE